MEKYSSGLFISVDGKEQFRVFNLFRTLKNYEKKNGKKSLGFFISDDGKEHLKFVPKL